MYHTSLTIQAVISFWRNYFSEFSGLCFYLKVFSNSLFKRLDPKALKSHFGCSAKLQKRGVEISATNSFLRK